MDPRLRLYSIGGIDIATFFGSFLAGGYLLSRNFRALGEKDAARNSLVLALLGTVAVFVAAFSLPELDAKQGRLVRFAFQTAQVGIIHLVGRRVLGRALASHEEMGGAFFSSWRAAGVGILFAAGITVVAVLTIAASDSDPPAGGASS